MEKEQTDIATDEERLAAINRTVEEHSVHEDVDVRSLVISAMDAYSSKRIKEVADERESTRQTIAMYRRFIYESTNPLREVLNDILAVFVPGIVYLLVLYFIVHQVGDWNTSLPKLLASIIISIPSGLGIALIIVSIPKPEHSGFPLGVLRDTLASFRTQFRFGVIAGGLIMTSLITWSLVRAFNSMRESNAIAFNSSKVIITGKSVSTIKDLQISPEIIEPAAKPIVIPLSPDKTISIRTQNEPQTKSVKYTIDDKNAFPGVLEAEINSKSGVIYWKDGEKTITQTQIYVCKIKDVKENNIVVVPLGHSKDITEFSGLTDSETPTITVLIEGTLVHLTIDQNGVNTDSLSKGENIILAYDPTTKNTISIERLSPHIKDTGSVLFNLQQDAKILRTKRIF